MPLIKSISGIRGTIGGQPGETLSPLDVVKFAAAYGTWIKQNNKQNCKIVVGRDGRMSGDMVQRLVISTLNAVGLDVIDVGLSTTPTVEMAVLFESAAGGIIITASHNPKEWNALKLLNEKGEFISAEVGKKILDIAAEESFDFVAVDKLGSYAINETALAKHIDAVVKYPLVKVQAIKEKGFKIVVDAINSTGAIAVPELLKALGVEDANIIVLNKEVNGKFAHNPEPLPEHLNNLCNEVKQRKADLGIAVDPDVDRLCFVCEDGSLFGEEYTLVAVADYILQHKKGNTVSNMSSTRALRDITEKAGGIYTASAVGEVNVVDRMKEVNAVIGGEGNGGVIVPDLHYGRDALIGIALFLSLLSDKKSAHHLRSHYPNYFISKNKIELENGINISKVFEHVISKYKNNPINKEDGLKIEFDKDWVHLRTSNTEPIVRIYAESTSPTTAENIAKRIMQDIKETM
ncbi:phosphoglucosamine mutase [Arachidicoccus sp.]|jgi:phosphomannomutase|uniref:phosphoglucosamine mutase n=1 Tax=Arachidicoccus sp. TaxID=1872624 RepID=UPI003D20B1D4